jgi:hypothetical protein
MNKRYSKVKLPDFRITESDNGLQISMKTIIFLK